MSIRSQLQLDLKNPLDFLHAVAARKSFFVPTRSERELYEYVELSIRVRMSNKAIQIPAKIVGKRKALDNGAVKLSAGVMVLVEDVHDEGVLLLEGICGKGIVDLQRHFEAAKNEVMLSEFRHLDELESALLALRNGDDALVPGESNHQRGDRFCIEVLLGGQRASVVVEVEMRGFSRRDGERLNRVSLRHSSARKDVDLFLAALKVERSQAN